MASSTSSWAKTAWPIGLSTCCNGIVSDLSNQVGDFLYVTCFESGLNCLSGVHDGPKVAMSGDRLVNGAGVSLETMGPVDGWQTRFADTDGRNR